MSYRLAAFDLDGTLLNSQNQLSPVNAAALARLASQGVHIAAATARGYPSVIRHFAPRGLAAAAICSGGADVRSAEATVLARHELPPEFLRLAAALSEAHGLGATFAGAELTVHRLPELPDPMPPPRPGFRLVDRFEEADFEAILTAMLHTSRSDSRLDHLLEWADRLHFAEARSFDGAPILAVTPAGADKGTGLVTLCEHLGIEPADCVVFGDSEGDLPMFRIAGLAVAVANATSSALEAAGHHTASNDEDGVAAAIAEIWG